MSNVRPRVHVSLGRFKPFHQRSLRGRVLLSQLPLLVTLIPAVVIAGLVHRHIFIDPSFGAGLALVTLLTVACGVVPWERLPYPSYWVIPLGDFLAIGLLRAGGSDTVTGLSLLAIFPVFWMAWSGVNVTMAHIASFVGPLGIVWAPVLINGPTFPQLAYPLLVPFVMLAVSISAAAMSRSMDDQQGTLRQKDALLSEALAESRERARLLDAVLDTVDVGVVVVDADGKNVLMNRRQQRNHELALPTGSNDAAEAELLVFGPDGKTPLPEAARPVRRAVQGESFKEELLWLGEGSQRRAMAASAEPMMNDGGAFAGSVVAFNDVTKLVNAVAAKEDFVAGVSHELRTPLTSILGYLDLAMDYEDELPAGVSSALVVATRNAERLQQLVADLLVTASGRLDIFPRQIELDDVVSVSVEAHLVQASAVGIDIVCELPPRLPALVDPNRMDQVLNNLLSNAIKYSPDGGTITVRAWREKDEVVLQVQDTGMGMAEADTAEIFTRFYRTGAVRSAAIPGVGLGMSITKEIVEGHRGTIICTSTMGVGTTFTVRLPHQPALEPVDAVA